MTGLHARLRGGNGKSPEHFESESEMIGYRVRKDLPGRRSRIGEGEQKREALRQVLARGGGP